MPAAGAVPSVKALLVGERVGGRLRFAAAVGSGFAQAERRALVRLLEPLSTADSPFAPPGPGLRESVARWVVPRLECEVRFLERTADGRLRHPVWHGLARSVI